MHLHLTKIADNPARTNPKISGKPGCNLFGKIVAGPKF
jgi:hypothetical protein